ncbi:23S rRNA (adenine(2030)-N(6))-methyltransferase RlmJ [Roseicyclus persicicus]|uniref:Ribosomal RNA large subunit methyltransferase J n=1 Tax=Roseicyclus persicicus TaxID=2650661 RepID=A0A7X6JXF7_9RHOB|nr:23S rRNA (adenine(2030)-N(6))-methyltransferase RlmJ [Roseibacterium persicicum]NKX43030.1 23S rRNA (adenine(2030)-N(6))-methyltransferase RlmJ [Roseibacterium persicicum]
MLSYQHAYHAGNLADVHKHALLAVALDHMTRKDKPLSYFETHAGRGLYRLDGPEAAKTGEAAQGILRVAGWFPADHPYSRARAAVAAAHGPAAYPGSPLLAAALLRPFDTMTLAELHPAEVAALREALPKRYVQVVQEDGLAMALSRTPPEPRRGLMLIDPSYEVKTDYDRIPDLMQKLHRKWNVGVLMLWYPVLATGLQAAMARSLRASFPDALSHEVRFPPARPGHGMTGSGLFVINPPFGLSDEAQRLTRLFARL